MLRNLEFTIPIIKSEFKKIKRYIDSLAQIRSGFFCTICDADFQNHLDFIWEDSGTDLKFSLGNKFCNKFVETALPFSQFIFRTFKLYVNTSVTLIECEKQEKGLQISDTYEYKTNEDLVTKFQKCQDGYTGGSKFGCEEFCSNFDLTSINPMIDGDAQELRAAVEYFKQNYNIFTHPHNNFLVDSIQDTEILIDINWEQIHSKTNFFDAVENKEGLDIPNTKMQGGTGVDIFHLVDANKYSFHIESQNILSSLIVLFVSMNLFLVK